MWPSTRVEITGYPGWGADVYDLSVAEVDVLENAVDQKNLMAMAIAILPSIKSWNLLSRAGDSLPVTEEGIKQLPLPAIRNLLTAVLESINKEAIPKETTISELSDITPL